MTGILWYKDDVYLNDGEWNQFAISELVDLTYVDEVYKPAVFTCTIQNISGGGGLAQSSVAHNGGGSVGGDIIVTKSGHSLSTTDRIFISSETTGDVEPRVYEVEKIDNNTFYIRHFAINPWSGRQQTGSSANRITGQYAGSTGGTLTYVPTGKYSIASPSVANPDFRMGQEIIYWHMPEEFSFAGPYTHTGADTDGLVVAHTAHGYHNGKILQVVNESTSAVADGEYQVWAKATDSYKLRHPKSLDLINGNDIEGTIHLYLDNNSKAFPLFYGTITSLEGAWSPAYGKIIKIQAKDHFQYFSNTTVKKIQKTFRTAGEKIGSGDAKHGFHPQMGTALKSPIYLDGKTKPNPVITDPLGPRIVTESKVSHAIANIVSDFNEGAGLIYTDNNNGSGVGMLCEKFDASGFEMTDEELTSGQFKRDLTDVGHKVLRAMQDMAMSDRHVTTHVSVTGATWSATGGGTNPLILAGVAGLEVGQTIGIKNSSVHATGVFVPNGHYVLGTGARLLSLDGNAVDVVASNGTCDVAGAEDGNFGYDFYLDTGIYGVPNEYGYTLGGLGTDGTSDITKSYTPRPHVNYFKRGYRPFRPDATGLNIVSPSEDDTEETGQIRIMMKNTSWTLGDDEIISDVELQITDTEEGNTDKSELGHNLQLMRTKKIQCCNNVDAFTQRSQRLNHAGRWNGQFHWNRHDSFDNKVLTHSVEKHETLVGINDQAMFCGSGGTLTSPGFEDTGTWWLPSTAGFGTTGDVINDFWGAQTYVDVGGSASAIVYGTVQDREILRRVIFNEMGGIGFSVGGETVVSTDNVFGGGPKISGYAGPSQVPLKGRGLVKGPGVVATVNRFETGVKLLYKNPAWGFGLPYVLNQEEYDDNPFYLHTYPTHDTGIVDCDLIKSIKNCEEEGLMTTTTYSPTSIKDDDGDLLVNDGDRHHFQTGAMIVITSGTALDTDDYWNNYKRVEIPLPPAWWKPLDGFTGSGTGVLYESINALATTVTLEAGQGANFPGADFLITIGDVTGTDVETMRCSSRTGDVLTVVRGELITTTYGGAPRTHTGSHFATGVAVALDTTSFNVLADGRLGGRQFYLTDLPHEAYEGIVGTIPAALPMSSSNRMQYSEGTITGYKRVYNVFDGACRIQYQSTTTRNELPNTDSYVLISDRSKLDVPYMGVEVYAIADEDRKSSTSSISGLTTGAATMPDSVMYGETGTTTAPNAVTGFVGGVGRYINEQIRSNAMPVRFRTGDKLSETRFLMRDEGTNAVVHAGTAYNYNCKHLFKNTQAIITENLMDDKKRAKTQSLSYGAGNDFNEVRRTAASVLTRTAKDLVRGTVNIYRYPFIELTGVAGSDTTANLLHQTQNVLTYGGRPGMLVTKTDSDGNFLAGVLAEQITNDDVRGKLNTGSWAIGNNYKMYIHLRAGNSVRVVDPFGGNSVATNAIITKLTFSEGSSIATTALEVIGYQDLPTATPVRPLGTVTKAVVDNKGALSGPITLGKARLSQLTFSSGDPS